mmetsp:Transcript_18841/g.32183  ORF Transcript_18841/g.32183 Transcript_18841/m.32183 type:complete len:562 (-) Transcript_18841:652-2337(-)
MRHYSPKFFAFLSVIVSIVNSLAFPMFGYIFSELLFVIMIGDRDPDFIEKARQYVLYFLYLALSMGTCGFLQKYLFFVTGENLTFDVRNKLFESLVHKQISWYDRKERAPGVISNILSEDISGLNGLTTETIATLFESFLSLVIGITVSAFFEWRMAIVCFLATPFVLLGGIIMARLGWNNRPGARNNDGNAKKKDPYQESNALLSDLILNYRTVISFGQENVNQIMDKYENLLEGPAKMRVRNAHIAGVAFGYSVCVRFIYIGIIFYIGSEFIKIYNLNSQDVYQSINILFTAALGAGFAMSQVPSATQAKESAKKIFSIIDEPSKLDSRERKQLRSVKEGKIEFKEVTFNYPTRKQKVLNKFCMDIKPGMKIGLVGHSGCGKSTITNLILRYYDLQHGQILVDGLPISDYDVKELREQIGFVMQEPVLFNASIKENILFGKLDSSDAKVRQMAEMANALQFIESNFEELTQAEQLDIVRKEIRDKAQSLRLSQLLELSRLADLQALMIVKSTLENSDDKFQRRLAKDQGFFIEIVRNELCDKDVRGMKWDDLIVRTEWK